MDRRLIDAFEINLNPQSAISNPLFYAYRRPEIRSRQPEEFVDISFVAELDKSGFIKKLYEQK